MLASVQKLERILSLNEKLGLNALLYYNVTVCEKVKFEMAD